MVGTHADLAAHAATWPTHPKTNEQVAAMLAICRRLFEHTYFVYEFGVVEHVLVHEPVVTEVLDAVVELFAGQGIPENTSF